MSVTPSSTAHRTSRPGIPFATATTVTWPASRPTASVAAETRRRIRSRFRCSAAAESITLAHRSFQNRTRVSNGHGSGQNSQPERDEGLAAGPAAIAAMGEEPAPLARGAYAGEVHLLDTERPQRASGSRGEVEEHPAAPALGDGARS